MADSAAAGTTWELGEAIEEATRRSGKPGGESAQGSAKEKPNVLGEQEAF